MSPRTPYLLVALFSTAIPLLTGVAAAYWVGLDAAARGSDSRLWWTVLTLAGLPLTLPYYVLWWRRRHDRERPRTRAERAALVVTASGVASLAAVGVLAPPDPVSQALYSMPAFVLCPPVAWWLTR
ncbi:hypothetical protein [Halarchaeum sp. P4]|uniref:hypothetical protein n=1 Tax=Halarchaeum sp. P4 TaxID=3421639 RepID=UPI003EC06D46